MTERELLAETLRSMDMREVLIDTYLNDADYLLERGYRRDIETVYDVVKVAQEILIKYIPMPKLEQAVKDLKEVTSKIWHIDWEDSEDEGQDD